MYRVALVQNQSEMAHYGYADAQPYLRDLGYDVALFTAHNIHLLRGNLATLFDAVVLASNSLNDKTIRSALRQEEAGGSLTDFLAAGGGLLSLHQLGMSTIQEEHFPFLPDTGLRELRSVVRPLHEDPKGGRIGTSTGTKSHVLLRYPHMIQGDDVASIALSFRSLPGLYWHWWEGVNLERWDLLLEDSTADASRALLVATKQSSQPRAVFAALPLDWQRQHRLLENLLRYIVEGRHSTAVLYDPRQTSIGFDYLLRSLTSHRFPYRRYALDTNVSELERYVDEGLHTSLVLAPHVALHDLSEQLLGAITRNVEDGSLRLIRIDQPSPPSSVGSLQILSRQRYALTMLQAAELRIQAELRAGYVDGSFWGTAEVLQKLSRIKLAASDYGATVGPTLAGIDRHDRNGSYDGVFGATCAACWIRATYLGPSHPKTQLSVNWIRSAVPRYEDRERALAYTTFLQTGLASQADRADLISILSTLEHPRLTQSDLIAYMQAALAVDHLRVLPGLLATLCDRRQTEPWTDLATAAEASSVAQDAMTALLGSADTTSQLSDTLRPRVDNLVYSTVVELQDALDRSEFHAGAERYPWDGKASTAIKCIETWLKFDCSLDLPVYEASDVLETGARRAQLEASSQTALAVLEELKLENDRLRNEVQVASAEVAAARRLRVSRRIAAVALVTTVYLMISFIAGVGAELTWVKVASAGRRAFVDAAPFHLAVLALVAGYAVLPWRRWLDRDV